MIFAPERVIVRDGAKERARRGVLAGIDEAIHIGEVDAPSHERRRRSVSSNQDGQTMVEYGVILTFVALVATAAFTTFGQAVVALLGPIVKAL